MALTENDIDKIARLARLKLTPQEKRNFMLDLNSLLECMEIIDEINVENVSKMSRVLTKSIPLREDIVK